MTIHYVNFSTGSDTNGGASWGAAKKNLSAVSPSAGDEVRVAKTGDPVAIGSATWLDDSRTVVFASPPAGLSVGDFISKNGAAAGGDEPWWLVSAISGNAVTLDSPALAPGYIGTSETATTYRRSGVLASPQDISGWVGAGGSPITITSGWNTSSGLQDGETFLLGSGTGTGIKFVETGTSTPGYLSIDPAGARLSIARFSRGIDLNRGNLDVRLRWVQSNRDVGFYFVGTSSTTQRVAGLMNNWGHGVYGSGGVGFLDYDYRLIYSNGWGSMSPSPGLYHHHMLNYALPGDPTARKLIKMGRVIGNRAEGLNIESYQYADCTIDWMERNGSPASSDPENPWDTTPQLSIHTDYEGTFRVGHIGNPNPGASSVLSTVGSGGVIPPGTNNLYVDYVDTIDGVPLFAGYPGSDTTMVWHLPPVLVWRLPSGASSFTAKGLRKEGSTVTVTSSSGSVGAVSYPDALTWSAPVSGVDPGITTVTATLGTGETAAATVEVVSSVDVPASPALLALQALPATISLSLSDRIKFPGPLKVWNGTAFVDAAFKAFDGSTLS